MGSSDIALLHCAVSSFPQHVPRVLGLLPILLSHNFNRDCHRGTVPDEWILNSQSSSVKKQDLSVIARGGHRIQTRPFRALLSRFRSNGGKKIPADDTDDEENAKTLSKRPSNNLKVQVIVIVAMIVLMNRILSMVTPHALSYIDDAARNFWLVAEHVGLIEPFQNFSIDYHNQFPEFCLLEDNWQIIRDEAVDLLATKRKNIPRLKDLYVDDPERAASNVYKTDWKTFWFKMGAWIPENEALAPKTAKLLHQIPGLSNAFFSILEPNMHIDPHWGHYKGFVRYHLGLIIPNNNTNKDSFLRVRSDIEKNNSLGLPEREELLQNGTFYYWHEGEGVMFDDNQLHDATNNSDEVRVVLFLDVARKLPWYLDIVNRIAIYVANRQSPIISMRKHAILDENRTLSVG